MQMVSHVIASCWFGKLRLTLSWTCIYGGRRVFFYVGSTTVSYKKSTGGASGVMVIIVGNGHGDTSSNPGQD